MTKRILSIALALVLTLAMSSGVLAADKPHTAFTFEEGIVDPAVGQTFTIDGLLAIQAESVTLNLQPLDPSAYTIGNDAQGKVTSITLTPATLAALDETPHCLIVEFDKCVAYATFVATSVETAVATEEAAA
ncbi:MAG: hypothetical protein LBU86_05385 [Oscillospiraceae bacterium]|jgi:hypothetical protein|nr:hypothetical protein [Oscillospiraceae bacterium]